MRRTDRFGFAGAALEPDDLDVGVARQEPDELRADVAGGPDDADPDPLVRASRAAAPSRRGAGAAVRRDSSLDAAALTGARGPSRRADLTRARDTGGSPSWPA